MNWSCALWETDESEGPTYGASVSRYLARHADGTDADRCEAIISSEREYASPAGVATQESGIIFAFYPPRITRHASPI